MKKLQITPMITPRDDRAVNNYLRDITKQPLLSIEEEVELAQRIRQGDECALERLILGNVRFVVFVAKRYQNRGLDLADLISAGNIGLITAAKRFDETMGNKFCSYAIWWIRHSILQSLAKEGRTVTLPANQLNLLSKIKQETSRLEQELQRTPSHAEVTEVLDEEDEKVCHLLSTSQHILSLDAPIQDNEEEMRIDTLTDPSAPQTDYNLMRESLHSDIESILSNLSQNERRVVKMYFGIGHRHSYSIGEIGMRIGMSRERVRQLHNRALLRLQNSTTKERLRAYL